MEYTTARGDIWDFEAKVKELLQDGWLPFGGISVTHNSNVGMSNGYFYAQAFTKQH